jgi:hypothetical protein
LLTQESDDFDTDVKDAPSESDSMILPAEPLVARAASLVHALTALSHEGFLNLMRRIYTSLLMCLHGAKMQSQVISDVVDELRLKG